MRQHPPDGTQIPSCSKPLSLLCPGHLQAHGPQEQEAAQKEVLQLLADPLSPRKSHLCGALALACQLQSPRNPRNPALVPFPGSAATQRASNARLDHTPKDKALVPPTQQLRVYTPQLTQLSQQAYAVKEACVAAE